MKKLALLTVIFSILALSPVLFAQDAVQTPISAPSHLASPEPAPMPMTLGTFPSATGHAYLGFDLGLTYSWLEGANNFFWPVLDNTSINPLTGGPNNIFIPVAFSSLGSGVGGIFGIKAGIPLSNSIDFEGKIRYQTNYTSETEAGQLPVVNTGGQSGVTNSYSALLSSIDIAAMLHFALSSQWYAAGGLSFSGLLSNRFTTSQTLPSGLTYVDTNGNATTSTEETVPSGSQSNLFNSGRLDLQLGAGTVIPMSSNTWALDAELLLSIPLTSWIEATRQTSIDNSATDLNGIYERNDINFSVAQPTFPNLWYASLTIGIRFPFGSQAAATNEEPTSAAPSNNGVGDDGKVALKGRVVDGTTGNPVRANMTVVDLTNNQVVATDETDGDGNYNVRVKAPGKYSVTADADGYVFGTAYFEVDDEGRILAQHPDIKLSSTSTGSRVRLLVFFDFNSATLKASSYPELNRAVRLMKAVPSMSVEIAGYTDNIGSDDANRKVSQLRANAVRDYLVQNGIAKNRVTATGYGKDSPIADNSTEDGRAENRRVEFVVLSK